MTHLIGIMADSHGKPETILTALEVLKDLNCRSIYHLGDVCDSTRPETAEACLQPLQEHHVITIKGNNEFPHHVIFRGHSHTPEILRRRGRRIESSTLAVGAKINLAGRLPCVVTCGALTRGLCMVWDEEDQYVECISFKLP